MADFSDVTVVPAKQKESVYRPKVLVDGLEIPTHLTYWYVQGSGLRQVLLAREYPAIVRRLSADELKKFMEFKDNLNQKGSAGRVERAKKMVLELERGVTRPHIKSLVDRFGPVPAFAVPGVSFPLEYNGEHIEAELAIYPQQTADPLSGPGDQTSFFECLDIKLDRLFVRYLEEVAEDFNDMELHLPKPEALERSRLVLKLLGESIGSKLKGILKKGKHTPESAEKARKRILVNHGDWIYLAAYARHFAYYMVYELQKFLRVETEREQFSKMEKKLKKHLKRSLDEASSMQPRLAELRGTLDLYERRKRDLLQARRKLEKARQGFGASQLNLVKAKEDYCNRQKSPKETEKLKRKAEEAFDRYEELVKSAKEEMETELSMGSLLDYDRESHDWLEGFKQMADFVLSLHQAEAEPCKVKIFFSHHHDVPVAETLLGQVEDYLKKNSKLKAQAIKYKECGPRKNFAREIRARIWLSDGMVGILPKDTSDISHFTDKDYKWIAREAEHGRLLERELEWALEIGGPGPGLQNDFQDEGIGFLEQHARTPLPRLEKVRDAYRSGLHMTFVIGKADHKADYLDENIKKGLKTFIKTTRRKSLDEYLLTALRLLSSEALALVKQAPGRLTKGMTKPNAAKVLGVSEKQFNNAWRKQISKWGMDINGRTETFIRMYRQGREWRYETNLLRILRLLRPELDQKELERWQHDLLDRA